MPRITNATQTEIPCEAVKVSVHHYQRFDKWVTRIDIDDLKNDYLGFGLNVDQAIDLIAALNKAVSAALEYDVKDRNPGDPTPAESRTNGTETAR